MWSKDINDQLIFVNFCIFLLQWPTILILNEYKYWKNKKKKRKLEKVKLALLNITAIKAN